MINKYKSNKIKENSNTVRYLNNGTDHRHSKYCCDQSSPARRTMRTMVRPASFGFLVGVTRTHSKPVNWAERVPWGNWLEHLQNTKINTTVRAFQTKHVSDPACPIVWALRSAHCVYEHNSRCYYSYYSIVITGTQHGRHGVSNHRSFNWSR